MYGSLIDNIMLGLSVALSFENLLYCIIGVSLGMVIGVLPGIGSLVAISLLYPITFHIPPAAGLIMLAGLYYGSAYGGSTASILLNLPGVPSSAVVCLDGFPMSKQGRAGVALLVTALASFVGGSVGIILLMSFGPLIAQNAYNFGPREFFGLMLLGLVAASTMSSGSAIKGLGMTCLGILVGLVGADVMTGTPRFTFDLFHLYDGISMAVLALGLFGVAEVIASMRTGVTDDSNKVSVTLRSMIPTRDDMRRAWPAMLRGSAVGSFFGTIPGTGAVISSFIAYSIEKSVSKEPERFGNGAIEGVTGPEAANNAADQTSFIPTLTLGIPGSATMAIMLGVLMIHGIAPGPTLMRDQPDLVWGLIMSFWIGNLILLILNIPLVGLWVRLLTVPYHVLYPAILMFVCVGIFSINNSSFEIGMILVISIVGYGMRLLSLPAAPLLLGFILGPMIEEHFQRSMMLARGDLTTFLGTPISFTLMMMVAGLLTWRFVRSVTAWSQRRRMAQGAS